MIEELKQVREALDKIARLGNEPYYGNSVGNMMANETLKVLDRLIAGQEAQALVMRGVSDLSHDLYHSLSWLYEVAKVSDTNYAAVTHASTVMKRHEESGRISQPDLAPLLNDPSVMEAVANAVAPVLPGAYFSTCEKVVRAALTAIKQQAGIV